MMNSTRRGRFVLALALVALVLLSAAAVPAVEDPLVPERYIITKSDPYSDNDTALDANCMPHGTDTVSCPGCDGGRLFDMVDPSSNTNMKWKISHHWRASERREVSVNLVFPCPITISAMTWHFFLDSNALPPTSANWSVTAVGEKDSISQYITSTHRSTGMTTLFSMSSISGFPASRQWRIVIPMPPSQWLFLYEVGISGKMEQIVPQSYSITESDHFLNVLPDDHVGCVTENLKTNCSSPGKLFDGIKPDTASNVSLFHLWQIRSNRDVQLMLMFKVPVFIKKVEWKFYYNSNGSPSIPAANITHWSLTAYNGIDKNVTDMYVTRKTMHSRLLVYTVVIQGTVVAQRWGSTFSAPNGQWLLLSEVEIAGSNAERSEMEMFTSSTRKTSTSSARETSTPNTREMSTSIASTMEVPTSSTNLAGNTGGAVAGIAVGVVMVLVLLMLLSVTAGVIIGVVLSRRTTQDRKWVPQDRNGRLQVVSYLSGINRAAEVEGTENHTYDVVDDESSINGRVEQYQELDVWTQDYVSVYTQMRGGTCVNNAGPLGQGEEASLPASGQEERGTELENEELIYY